MTKEEKIEQARQWLINQDAEFREFANGHFRVFQQGDPVIDFWATTLKYKVFETNSYHVGGAGIKQHVQMCGGAPKRWVTKAPEPTDKVERPARITVDDLEVDELPFEDVL